MKEILKFLIDLEKNNIHYKLEHNRDDFIMVIAAIPGERWEIEFSEEGEVEIEIFKSSSGVLEDKELLTKLLKYGK